MTTATYTKNSYFNDGKINHFYSFIVGTRILHTNDDTPAMINYFYNGQIESKSYYKNGLLHREGQPAISSYEEDGTIFCETYYIQGQLCRLDDEPCYTCYYPNGLVNIKYYYVNHKLHRENNKPAHIEYDQDGDIVLEQYYIDGHLERLDPDDPTIVEYKNGDEKYIFTDRNGTILKTETHYAVWTKGKM